MKRRLQRRTLLRCQELPRPQLLQRLMPSRPCWLLQQQQRQQRHRCLARTKVCQALNSTLVGLSQQPGTCHGSLQHR